MKLFHFTSLIYLDRILIEGINRGEIPITPEQLENGVWLTSDATAEGQGWTGSAGFLPDGGYSPDKTAVRLTVEIADDDNNLQRWPVWAKQRRVSTSWYKRLDRAGGGGSLNWYVYTGVIPPSAIVKVEELRAMTAQEAYFRKKFTAGEMKAEPIPNPR